MRPLLTVFLGCTIIAITIFRCFSGISSNPVERWDEQTNIDVVKDTLANQTFPILTLSEKPFFEKPPFWYYLATGVSSFTGVSFITLRLLSAVFGSLLIFSVVLAAYRWWGLVSGSICFTLMITTNHLFVNNPAGIFSTHTLKSADVDSLFLLLLFLSFVCAINAYRSIFLAVLTGIMTGLAVLTKGPLGITPLITSVLVLYITLNKKQRYTLVYSFVALLITVFPWYLLMTYRFGPEFIASNLGYHVFQRMLVPLEGHENFPWFYFSILSNASIFPYGIPYAISMVWFIIRKIYIEDVRITYAFIMSSVCLLIPTITQTKLAWYILPFYPFAILAISGTLTSSQRTLEE
jgi:4-amino-4-deoxy-L-arabinose transferase-like glycosyltransferase